MEIKKSEVSAVVIGAVVLGFVFGFDDGLPQFEPTHWFLNFLLKACFGLVFLLLFYIATKRRAARDGGDITVNIWGAKRFGIRKDLELKYDVPLGVLVPFFVSFISYGFIPFASVLTVKVKENALQRLKKKWQHISDYELVNIYLAGPLILIWAGILINIITPRSSLMFMALIIALCHLLPIPGLNGMYVYFGSPLTYVFYTGMTILLLITLPFLSTVWSVVTSIFVAFILFMVYYQRKMVLEL